MADTHTAEADLAARADAPDPDGVAAAVAAVPPDEPDRVADAAGLTYVRTDEPGITRRRRGRGFTYLAPDGTTIARGSPERERLEALVLPPAWTDVWICTDPDGHLQATGRDTRGRTQYRYHDRWRTVRDAAKFHRLAEFAGHLPAIRAHVDTALRRRALDRERVVALVIALLDETLIRVGNGCYTEENGTYGLTTLTDEHVEVVTGRATFEFVGKGGVEREVELRDRRLARAVAACEELPGQCLFSFVEDDPGASRARGDGVVTAVESTHVNDRLHELTGAPFTAKDFRTWGGTVTAAATLHELGPRPTAREQDAAIVAAIDAAADRLGNTRAIARDGYVHPAVADAYRDGQLEDAFRGGPRQGLTADESATARLLEARTDD